MALPGIRSLLLCFWALKVLLGSTIDPVGGLRTKFEMEQCEALHEIGIVHRKRLGILDLNSERFKNRLVLEIVPVFGRVRDSVRS